MDHAEDQSQKNNDTESTHQKKPDMVYEDDSFLLRTEVRQGIKPGDVRVRMVRPSHTRFRRLDVGLLEATAMAETPHTSLERATTTIKRLLIGAPLATGRVEYERLTKFKALAVLASDAISSVAYAPEVLLITLVAAGSGNLWLTLPISLTIVSLLCIVAWSYRQTIPAYPNGGGSYIVAKDNLGTLPGLVAAASLMIDYVLTVSVSVAVGVQALATLFPGLSSTIDIIVIDVVLVIVITIVNLRGVRASGSFFAISTYIFIGSALLLILVGCIKSFLIQRHPVIGTFQFVAATEPLSAFLILKSFAAGCAAITGVEAISNGVPAFRKPEMRNAAITLTWMAVILGTLFIGITLLATSYHVEANATGNPTIIGQIAHQVFTGPLFFMFPVFQLAALFILIQAANTSYFDFPRVASLLARDRFLPSKFAFRGDRLEFSTGIMSLAVFASLLLIAFKSDTTRLINLYIVGVFMSFTLSQGGMVRHWWRLRKEKKGWQRSLIINGLGAVTTLLVALVIASTKFLEGTWIVVILIPLLVLMFIGIRHYYKQVESERITDIPFNPKDIRHNLIVPITGLDVVSIRSLVYAHSISRHFTALHISSNDHEANKIREALQEYIIDDHHLITIVSQTDSPSDLFLSYIDTVYKLSPKSILTVVLPEYVSAGWWEKLFPNQTNTKLRRALLTHPGIVITSVAGHLPNSSVLHREGHESFPSITLHPKDVHHRFVVPIAELDNVSVRSLAYARSISPRVAAVHIAIDPHDVEVVNFRWIRFKEQFAEDEETQLVIIESPYRSLVSPLLAYIDTIHELHPEEMLTVILPEFVVAHWWEEFLHNQIALQIRAALLSRPGIVVTSVLQHKLKTSRYKRPDLRSLPRWVTLH